MAWFRVSYSIQPPAGPFTHADPMDVARALLPLYPPGTLLDNLTVIEE